MAVPMVALAAAAEMSAGESSAMNGCRRSSAAVGRALWSNSNVLCRKLAASGEMSLGITGAASLPIYRVLSAGLALAEVVIRRARLTWNMAWS